MPNLRRGTPGSGGTNGATAPGANWHTSHSAALSARARQLTPQARERGGFELSRTIDGSRPGSVRVRAGVLAAVTATAAACGTGAVAFAQTATTATDATTTTGDATSAPMSGTTAESGG